METKPPAPDAEASTLFGGGMYCRMVCWGWGRRLRLKASAILGLKDTSLQMPPCLHLVLLSW